MPTLDSIRYLLLAKELPTQTLCALSHLPTDDVAHLTLYQTVRCEPSARASWWMLGFGVVFGMVPALLVRSALHKSQVTFVRQDVIRVPVRLSAERHRELPYFDQPILQMLLRSEPIYARLLDERPFLSIAIE